MLMAVACEKEENNPDFGNSNSLKTKSGTNEKASEWTLKLYDRTPEKSKREFLDYKETATMIHHFGCYYQPGSCLATVDVVGLSSQEQDLLDDLVSVISFGNVTDIVDEFDDNETDLNPIIGTTLVSGVINGTYNVEQESPTVDYSFLLFTDASTGANVNQVPLNW